MSRLKLYAVAIALAATLSGMLCEVYAMPESTLLACPGVVLGLMAAGNTPSNNNVIIFFGNLVFYFLLFLTLAELALIFRKMRTR